MRAGGLPEFIFANEILFHDRNISHILFANENGNHDVIVIRSEIAVNVHGVYVATFQLGVKPAITLNPDTPVSAIEPYLNQVDMVLVMSVVPGAGGQKFIPESLDKIRRIKKLLDENQLHADIEVDGGINTDNVRAALDAGANIIVAGSAVFKGDAAENVKKFKELM